jgi:hypothetical protein
VAALVPRWNGGRYGYLYDVVLDGETIDSDSHDPGHDACRALFSRGKTGKLTLVDETGVARMSFDIVRAAFLTVSEESVRGLRLRRDKTAASSGDNPEREAGTPPAAADIGGGPNDAHARDVRHWERDDDYPYVVLRIGADWRIIGCRDDIQWIVQRRAGSTWRSRGHCRSRTGLQSMLRRCGLDPTAVADFPEFYVEGRRAAGEESA